MCSDVYIPYPIPFLICLYLLPETAQIPQLDYKIFCAYIITSGDSEQGKELCPFFIIYDDRDVRQLKILTRGYSIYPILPQKVV